MAIGIETVFGSGNNYNFETNTNTINTLQNTGDIKLIPNILRNKILDLNRKQLDLKDYRKTKMTLLLNSVISNKTLYGGAELENRIGNQPKLIKNNMDENIQVQIIVGPEAVLSEYTDDQLYTKKCFIELIKDSEEITKLINEELKK